MREKIANKVREGRNKPAHEVADSILKEIATEVEGMPQPPNLLPYNPRATGRWYTWQYACRLYKEAILKKLKGE